MTTPLHPKDFIGPIITTGLAAVVAVIGMIVDAAMHYHAVECIKEVRRPRTTTTNQHLVELAEVQTNEGRSEKDVDHGGSQQSPGSTSVSQYTGPIALVLITGVVVYIACKYGRMPTVKITGPPPRKRRKPRAKAEFEKIKPKSPRPFRRRKRRNRIKKSPKPRPSPLPAGFSSARD